MIEPSEGGGPIQRTARNRRLARGVYVLPSLFTVGNIFCGYYAVLATMHGLYSHAAYAIGIAIILDAFDGWIARMTNSSTAFGLQLDSLADVISFGIAPSVLALVWGLSAADNRLAWTAAFTFTICGAMRLARFNIQTGHLKHFVGLPIPAGGGAIAAVVHFFGDPIKDPVSANLMVACVFMVGFLMISTFRYSSLKSLTWGKKSYRTILLMALLVALIFYYSRPTLLALAAIYVVSGPALKIYHLAKRRKIADGMRLADSAQRQ